MAGINQVTKALSKEDIARVEARQQEEAAKAEKVAAAKALGLPEFITGPGYSREIKVPLLYPFTHGGVLYEEVTIRRPLMREWRAYLRACQDAVNENGPGADDWVDQPWFSVSAMVLENMDFNDAAAVEAASAGFFARSRSDQKLLQDGLTEEELQLLKEAEAEQEEADRQAALEEREALSSTSTTGEPSP